MVSWPYRAATRARSTLSTRRRSTKVTRNPSRRRAATTSRGSARARAAGPRPPPKRRSLRHVSPRPSLQPKRRPLRSPPPANPRRSPPPRSREPGVHDGASTASTGPRRRPAKKPAAKAKSPSKKPTAKSCEPASPARRSSRGTLEPPAQAREEAGLQESMPRPSARAPLAGVAAVNSEAEPDAAPPHAVAARPNYVKLNHPVVMIFSCVGDGVNAAVRERPIGGPGSGGIPPAREASTW